MEYIEVQTLIISATYAALGYAATHPDTLIIEEHELIGSDYAMTFRSVDDKVSAGSADGQELIDFFRRVSVIDGLGKFDRLRALTGICRFVNQKKLSILLDATVISIEYLKEDDSYHVNVYTNSGIRSIKAKQLIDSSNVPKEIQGTVSVQKQLNAICSHSDTDPADALQAINPAITTSPGYFSGEWTVHVPFSSETTLSDARIFIEEAWGRAFGDGSVLIDAIAFDFDKSLTDDLQIACGKWINPKQFANPIEAYEAGTAFQYAG